jgi:hypothetical protein
MTKRHIDRLKGDPDHEQGSHGADGLLPPARDHRSRDRASQPAASAMLLHVILELVERHCGQELFVLAPFFLHAATYRLWHGGCHLGGYVTHLLYFDDVQTGMLSIVRPQDPASVDYLRFTVLQRAEAAARN